MILIEGETVPSNDGGPAPGKSAIPGGQSVGRPVLYSVVVGLLGLAQAMLGLQLAVLGGSLYYVLSGVLIVVAAWLVWRKDERGMWLYALFVAATIAWAFFDAGRNFWAVAAQIGGPITLGLWFLFPGNRRKLSWPQGNPGRPSPAVASVAALAVIAISAFAARSAAPEPKPDPGRFNAAPVNVAGQIEWPAYGRDLSGVKYVPTTQINLQTVNKLEQVWQFRTGDMGNGHPVWSMTPLQIGDSLFLCTPSRHVIALDPDTGQQRWRFETKPDTLQSQNFPGCRGLTYHADAKATGVQGPGAESAAAQEAGLCSARILSTTFSGDLWALDSKTGKPCPGFGKDGVVTLLADLGPMTQTRDMVNTTPGIVVGDLFVVGGQVVDGRSTNEPSGVIRAFDVHTGALRWAWDMGAPGREGAPKPGETYTRSTPNSWTSFAADPALGLIYVPTGNSSPDFFGGYRRPYDEEYSVALVALDAQTGRAKWSFQAVHHDLWDLDLPAQPVLIDWPSPSGGTAPAVVVLSKTGDIFVLDRATGKPLVPVTEVPVPTKGGLKDDWVAPTQPISALHYRPSAIRESDMWGVSPFDQLLCRITYRQSRYEGAFTPPGLDQAIGFPATSGTFSWSGASYDPVHKVLVSNANNVPWVTRLIPRAARDAQGKEQVMEDYGVLAQKGTPYLYASRAFLSALGMPCLQPPWGEILAFDMTTNKQIWRKPLGTISENGPFKMPSHLPIKMGVPNAGGSIITAGGLVFIGATPDRYLRAFDLKTGAEVWRSQKLPAGANATPISYVSPSGKQYIVIAAGGHGYLGTKPGDYLLAFALKE